MMDAELLYQAMLITGMEKEQVEAKLQEVPCECRDALRVYQEAHRWPSANECMVINNMGYEVWEAYFYARAKHLN